MAEKIFERILAEKQDVTDTYLIHDDAMLHDIKTSFDQIYKAREILRHYVTNEIPHYPHDAVDFETWRDPVLLDMSAICEANPLNRADFFAIDGTPATPHLRYSAMQMFAVAVMGMSYACLHAPETFLTRSVPTAVIPTSEDITNKEAFLQWVGELDVTETNQSWPTTFREYVEREYAIKKQPQFVLIDGPLITQNLMTQAHGRSLLMTFLSQTFLASGVIKSIKSSTQAHKVMALALYPGEALLIEPTYDLVKRRSPSYEKWMGDFFHGLASIGIDMWRGVYRPVTKAFGFECNIHHIESVISMLWSEKDAEHIGHEIPFLLNQVDAHIRKAYNAVSFKGHLTYRLGLGLDEIDLLDELDERDLR